MSTRSIIHQFEIEVVLEEAKHTGDEFLSVSRFQSIKTKILIFALLATIIPSLTLGWLSYLKSSKLLRERIAQELQNATTQASGEMDLWLKERLYDLRVFSSSYIISENLTQVPGKARADIETQVALNRIKAYLQSVRAKFVDYKELILIDTQGWPVVTSAKELSAVNLPSRWLQGLKVDRPTAVESYFDTLVGRKEILVAETIRASNGSPLGFLAAKIDLDPVGSILKSHTMGGIDEVYLLDRNHILMVSSESIPRKLPLVPHQGIPSSWHMDFNQPTDYLSYNDKAVVGLAADVSSMNWMIVAEMEKDRAYAGITRLRKITLMIVGGLMSVIGLIAYIFGHALVRPVKRLSAGAEKVATGHLDVDIPVKGSSEISYLTQVFNHMVKSLRYSREELSAANNALLETNKELHQTSITDGLTGLHNRKHIMELFDVEIARSQRYDHPLALLIMDIDHFKKVNDTYGHQTGDAVMRQLAEVFQGSVRDCDYIGRYGGEEFMIILPNSDLQSGIDTAERIRQNVSELSIPGDLKAFSITISIGVSAYPDFGGDAEALISAADDALYKAKARGRNRVFSSQRLAA